MMQRFVTWVEFTILASTRRASMIPSDFLPTALKVIPDAKPYILCDKCAEFLLVERSLLYIDAGERWNRTRVYSSVRKRSASY